MQSELIPIESPQEKTSLQIFTGGLDAVLADIATQAKSVPLDVTTEKGRKEIASVAHKVSKSKVALDEQGKALVEGVKKQVAVIDSERKRAREFLDNLRDEIRKPLTEFEEREEARLEGHRQAIDDIEALTQFDQYMPTAEAIREKISSGVWITARSRDWQEFTGRANEAIDAVGSKLGQMLADRERRDAQEAEAARLKAENDRLEREARERRIADRAAAKAKKDAEDLAEKVRLNAEKKLAAAKAAAEKAESDRKAAAAKAEDDAKAAAAKAESYLIAAVHAERERTEAEYKRKAGEQAKALVDETERDVIRMRITDDLIANYRMYDDA